MAVSEKDVRNRVKNTKVKEKAPTQNSRMDKPIIPRKRTKPDPEARKNIHMILKGEGVARLSNLRSDLALESNTEVFTVALELLDLLAYEHAQGSKLFLKRPGEKISPFEVFEH